MLNRGFPTRIIIVDDEKLIRLSTQAMLSSEPDLKVVGEAENGAKAVELCRELQPDLVLMDVQMPQMNGIAATRLIKEEHPRTIVLVVTAHKDLNHLLEAVRAGAAGYVLKGSTRQQLLDAVRVVLDGESPLDGTLALRLLRRLSEEAVGQKTEQAAEHAEAAPSSAGKQGSGKRPASLTPREAEVLQLLTVGKTNRQISRELFISLSTVKTHVEHIIAKLEVSDRTQAAVRALELGLNTGQGARCN